MWLLTKINKFFLLLKICIFLYFNFNTMHGCKIRHNLCITVILFILNWTLKNATCLRWVYFHILHSTNSIPLKKKIISMTISSIALMCHFIIVSCNISFCISRKQANYLIAMWGKKKKDGNLGHIKH